MTNILNSYTKKSALNDCIYYYILLCERNCIKTTTMLYIKAHVKVPPLHGFPPTL